MAREVVSITFEIEGDLRDIAAYKEKLAADLDMRSGRASRILDIIGKVAGGFQYYVVRSGTTFS